MSTESKQFDALEDILFTISDLTIEEKDVVLEAARLLGYERHGVRYPIKAGPTTNPTAVRFVERWRWHERGAL